MADEINDVVSAVEPSVTHDEVKKTRAPRRSKEQIAADLAAKKAGKGARSAKAGRANTSASISAKAPGKTSVKAATAKTAKPAASPSVSNEANDGFAELLELEAENQKLRMSLSEKLRTENAELRKKLGLA